MDKTERHNVYVKALAIYGQKAQLEMAQEEATELALAVRRIIRKPTSESFFELCSEIADVEIMIEQMKAMFFSSNMEHHVKKQVDFKMNRLRQRLEKEDEESQFLKIFNNYFKTEA